MDGAVLQRLWSQRASSFSPKAFAWIKATCRKPPS